jgi:hypothetical protein
MSNKRKVTRRSRKSLKGKWGKVGAPPKNIKFPARPFTMKQLFAKNAGACELTIRGRVAARLADRTVTQLDPRKQPKHGVGRPSDLFVETIHLNGRTPLAKSTVEIVSTPSLAPESVPVTVTETVTAAPAPEPAQSEAVINTVANPAPTPDAVENTPPSIPPTLDSTSAPAEPAIA